MSVDNHPPQQHAARSLAKIIGRHVCREWPPLTCMARRHDVRRTGSSTTHHIISYHCTAAGRPPQLPGFAQHVMAVARSVGDFPLQYYIKVAGACFLVS